MISNCVSSQIDTLSPYEKEFYQFKNNAIREFKKFKSESDSIFLLYLNDSWKEFEGHENPAPVRPKPKVEPVYKRTTPEIFIPDTIHNDNNDSIQGKVMRMSELNSVDHFKTVDFYGSTIIVPSTIETIPSLTKLDKISFNDFFYQISVSDQVESIILELKKKAIKHNLNDWGYLSLVINISKFYYTYQNDRNAFTWAVMLLSGYNIKIGYNQSMTYLLVPSDIKIYSSSYIIRQKEYFLLMDQDAPHTPGNLFIHELDFPHSKQSVAFKISEPPVFEPNPIVCYFSKKNIKLTLNKNLIHYYEDYPDCDLKLHFNTPISEFAILQLDSLLKISLNKLTNEERVEFLLQFVQENIRYSSDLNQFGEEKYQFAEETLFNNAGDCEDKAVLFAALLRNYFNQTFVGLIYPGHVSVGVNLNNCKGTSIIKYKNRLYYDCDPTYVGAESGMQMPCTLGTKPDIIDIQHIIY